MESLHPKLRMGEEKFLSELNRRTLSRSEFE